MELSPEDTLRLNVLLANQVDAIRIDESRMSVHALTGRGEAKVQLNPTCRDDKYLRQVKELLSGHVLGSPGGYPVFLRRWTRMGQARDQSLDKLLMLGEPEAVVAVVHAAGLTNELARKAWWALPNADNARRMLERECVVAGGMGEVLAEYLVEYLPFETEPAAMIASIRLVLQTGLISADTRRKLWERAGQKSAYLAGFLAALPDALPDPVPARADYALQQPALAALSARGNPHAGLLLRVLSSAGQTYLGVVERALSKPANQDVVNAVLDTVGGYFRPADPGLSPDAVMERIIEDADLLCGSNVPPGVGRPADLKEALVALPTLGPELRALLVLSRLGYPVVRPIFSQSTAIGSLMRRKLQPVLEPVFQQLKVLRTPRT
jgi:hypothetical protein